MKPLRIALILVLTAIWVLPVGFILVKSVNAHPTLSDANGNGLLDIWDVYDLQDMNLDLNGEYELRSNINASVTSAWNGGQGFTPVGDGGGSFFGSLEGNSYTIDQLYINRAAEYVGMFGAVSGSVINEVNMTNTYVRSNYSGAGSIFQGMLIGFVSTGTVTSCNIEGTIVTHRNSSGDLAVGGGIGGIFAGGSVVDTTVDVIMTVETDASTNYIGGAVGGIYQVGSISECSSEGTLNIGMITPGATIVMAGGFIGFVVSGSATGSVFISDSSASMDIESGDDSVNPIGFIGQVEYSGAFDTILIERCNSQSRLDFNSYSTIVGAGFGGHIQAGTISQCFASGTISNTGGVGTNYAMGFVYYTSGIGRAVEIKDSYSVTNNDDTVTIGAGFAGLIGTDPDIIDNSFSANVLSGVTDYGFAFTCVGNETVTNSFWDNEISGPISSCAGTLKTTTEMKTESTFTGAGWDFTSVWGIHPSINDGYPYLLNNPPPDAPPVANLPTVTTDYYLFVTTDSAMFVGTLTDEGDSDVTTLGFCYNTTGAPTTSDNISYKTGSFNPHIYNLDLTSLTSNTVYYVRAYATNSEGTGYGEILTVNTVPVYTDNTMCLDFQPTDLIPPSSPGTITDVSSYENNASYILADMIDGVTVYTSQLSSVGNFYPSPSSDFGEILIVPPQSGMEQQGDASLLPLYEIFEDAGNDIGMDPAILYTMMVLAMAMGVGFLVYLISGSLFVAIIIMIVMLAGFMSTGVMPFWILIFFVIFSVGLMYIMRQV